MLLDIDDHSEAMGHVTAMAIYPPKDANAGLHYDDISYDVSSDEIRAFTRNIRFTEIADGSGLGVEVDAFVYCRTDDDLVALYLVAGGFRFLLRDGDWGNLMPLSDRSAEIVRHHVAPGD